MTVTKLGPWGVAAAIVGAMAAPAATASAQERIATLGSEATKVSAYAGIVAWSERVGRRYRLMLSTPDGVRAARIRSRAVPFDVDLGPGPDGRPTAVYSRCRREGTYVPDRQALPLWFDGSGCELYLYSVAQGRERRWRGRHSATSETVPSIWRGRLAFVSRPDRRRRGGQNGVLMLGRVDGRGRTRAVSAGPGDPERTRAAYADALDLAGRRLAFLWRRGLTSEVRLTEIGRRSRLIERTEERATPTLDNASIVGGALYYSGLKGGTNGTFFFGRYDLSTGMRGYAVAPGSVSLSHDDAGLVYSTLRANPPGVFRSAEPDFSAELPPP